MFSGKTTWIIDYVSRLTPGSFVLFKPDIDTRFGKNICVTHHGKSYPAINLSTKELEFPTLKKEVKVILIDELNFFPALRFTKVIKKQQKMGRDIIGAGLLYDYKKQSFGATLPLSKIADTFIQLYARCDICNKKAAHSYRKVDIKNQFLLGAKETYGACCDVCWGVLNNQI